MVKNLQEKVFSSLKEVSFCLEKENNFLLNGNLEKVVENFPSKKKLIQLLEENLSLIKENKFIFDDRDKFKNLFEEFNILSEKNRILLESTIETQNKVLKILLVPEENEANYGYNTLGEYNKLNNTHQALAVKSDI